MQIRYQVNCTIFNKNVMEEEFKIKSNDIENLISQRISYNLKTIRNKWNFRNYDLARCV